MLFKRILKAKKAQYLNDKIRYETVYKIKQYSLVLAYVITIHKCQGMTYKRVACDLKETFSDELEKSP